MGIAGAARSTSPEQVNGSLATGRGLKGIFDAVTDIIDWAFDA
jgi:hypothetical protein